MFHSHDATPGGGTLRSATRVPSSSRGKQVRKLWMRWPAARRLLDNARQRLAEEASSFRGWPVQCTLGGSASSAVILCAPCMMPLGPWVGPTAVFSLLCLLVLQATKVRGSWPLCRSPPLQLPCRGTGGDSRGGPGESPRALSGRAGSLYICRKTTVFYRES